jgi:hypothetical protein
MGKPMGNGYPVSAVVTRREIADRLGHNVDFFNTVFSLLFDDVFFLCCSLVAIR